LAGRKDHVTKTGKVLLRLFQLLIPFLILTLNPLVSWGQVQISAEFDRKTVPVGDTVNFLINVTADSNISVSAPRLPSLNDFDLLNSNSAKSTSASFSNGQFTTKHSITYTFLLAPKREGVAKMGPVEVVVDGQPRLTRPQQISVIKGNGRLAQPMGRPRSRGSNPFQAMDEEMDLFNQLLRRRGLPGRGIQQPLPENAEDFFIQVEVDKESAYVGESVVASWYLYTAVNLTEIDTLKYPSLNGFWKEDIEIATRLNFRSGYIVNGVQYRRALLASYALFPIKPGNVKIDPYRAKCTVASNAFWGRSQRKEVTKQSREIPIAVKALPTAGRPDNFTGAVGNFIVKSEMKSKQFKVNSPISYIVEFEGQGNAKRIDLPELTLPEGLELYDTISESKFYKSGRSFKRFELLLVPRFAGKMEIPELKFSMFNPGTGKYYEQSVGAREIDVLPGEDGQIIASKPLQTSEAANAVVEKVLPGLLLTMETSDRFYQANRVGIWGALFLLMLLILVWKASSEFRWFNKSVGLQEKLKARFSVLTKAANENDWRNVGIEGSNLIYFVLGEISGEGGAHREIDRLLEMSPPIVRQEIGPELKKLLSYFELLGFAPEGVIGKNSDSKLLKEKLKDMDALLSKTIKVSNQLFSTQLKRDV